MFLSRVVVGCSLVSIALASPFHHHAVRNESSPCAQVSASATAQKPAATPTVPAQLAYDCITSVPLNKSAALDLLSSIVPYFRWQSNTVWLKNPPQEYEEKVQPGIDIWGGLEDIRAKVEAGAYPNEFEFGWALYRLTQMTHDGHFVYVPDVVGEIFNWARPIPLVSFSADGKALPKPYAYPDVLASSVGNLNFTPSAITKINGQKAESYLENWSQFGSLQDRDALYNNVFYNLAAVSIGSTSTTIGTFAGSGRGRWVYPGATTELEFENGTSTTLTNFARVLVDLSGVSDGESLYRKFFVSPKKPPTSSASAMAQSTPAPGYPPPVIREAANNIGGYYLEDEEYQDVAVLSVPSFVSAEASEIPFQQTGERFIAAARAAGKRRLIIDVSANGGGTILQGYDLYKQLFPTGLGHAAADRFRAFESTDLLGKKFSNISQGLPREIVSEEQDPGLYELQWDVVSSVFNYGTDLDAQENDTNFKSWEDKFGPVTINGDKFTNAMHWNLSDGLTPYNSGGIWIHGYRNLTNYTQPFAAEDIVVVTDGYCASTCTIFSELMRQRQGVRYISLGGRPSNENNTASSGGVKGSNNFPWSYIKALSQFTITELSTPEEGAALNKTQLGEYWSDLPFDRATPGTSLNVNFRDAWRDNDLPGSDAGYPLQFVYEEADCRILYTAQMTYDVTAIWKAVADSAWGEKNKCFAGSLGGGDKKRRTPKRELTWEEKALKSRMVQWRRNLRVEDYPLDLYTDLSKLKPKAQGFMYP